MAKLAGVAFYFKQWGGTRKHLSGRELEGKIYDAMPVAAEIPTSGMLELEPSVPVRD